MHPLPRYSCLMCRRKSIDVLKEMFRDELSKDDWRLVIKLKKVGRAGRLRWGGFVGWGRCWRGGCSCWTTRCRSSRCVLRWPASLPAVAGLAPPSLLHCPLPLQIYKID